MIFIGGLIKICDIILERNQKFEKKDSAMTHTFSILNFKLFRKSVIQYSEIFDLNMNHPEEVKFYVINSPITSCTSLARKANAHFKLTRLKRLDSDSVRRIRKNYQKRGLLLDARRQEYRVEQQWKKSFQPLIGEMSRQKSKSSSKVAKEDGKIEPTIGENESSSNSKSTKTETEPETKAMNK